MSFGGMLMRRNRVQESRYHDIGDAREAGKGEDSSRTHEARFGGMLSGPGWFQEPDSKEKRQQWPDEVKRRVTWIER